MNPARAFSRLVDVFAPVIRERLHVPACTRGRERRGRNSDLLTPGGITRQAGSASFHSIRRKLEPGDAASDQPEKVHPDVILLSGAIERREVGAGDAMQEHDLPRGAERDRTVLLNPASC